MRTKEEILTEFNALDKEKNDGSYLLIETLLDIRDLLKK